MMFKKLFLVVLVCAFMAPTNVFSDELKPYIAVSAGVIITEDSTLGAQDATLNATVRGANAELEYDTGVAFRFAAGAEIIPQVRGEVEYSFSTIDGDKFTSTVGSINANGDVDTNAFMFNGYYDFDLKSKWTPYLGGGIGVAWFNVEGSGAGVTIDDTVSEFAYQVMAGTSYQYTGNVALNAGYRYFGASDAGYPLLTASVDAHAIEFGMRYSF
jgi:OOP family OmpA-OmpF porin